MYKAYKFYSDPDKVVNDGRTGLKLLQFDDKGEYITLDPIIAKRMLPHFRSDEIELIEATKQVEEKAVKSYKCKYCEYETENKGELLAHYREHKKDGE